MSHPSDLAPSELAVLPESSRREPASLLIVFGIWAFMLTTNLVIVWQYCPRTVPVSDEFLTLGDQADLNLTWLWEQHAEHRIPLAKLIWMGTLKLTDYDFRIGNLFEVFAVGMVALMMILVMRRQRGETRITDAFFPLVLLNFGQTYPVFLWWWQVNHTLPALLACVLLLLLVRTPQMTKGDTLAAGVTLVLLALAGPGGLPYVPPLGAWFLWRSVMELRNSAPGTKRRALWPTGLAALAMLLVGLYFVGYDKANAAAAPPEFTRQGLRATLATTVKLMSVSIGTLTRSHWQVWGSFVALAWLLGCVKALAAAVTNKEERLRASALLCFLAGAGSLMLALGWARANLGDDNTFEGHYLSKGVPALCCLYFIWELFAKERPAGEMQAFLFTLVLIPCLLHIADRSPYLDQAQKRSHEAAAFDQDLRQGKSAYELFQRYKQFHGLEGQNPLFIARCLDHLRALGLGPFGGLAREDEIAFHGQPVASNDCKPLGSVWEATGMDPCLIYQLPKPQLIDAIRLEIEYPADVSEPHILQVYWRKDGTPFAEQQSFIIELPANTKVHRVAIPVVATMDGFRVDPDIRPCRFRLRDITLLTPGENPRSRPD